MLMVAFHITIFLTFPVAVPLEWNIMFAFVTVFLFLGFPTWDGYGLGDMSSPWLTAGIVAALLFFPVLGNLRPDLVSFLPSMRQYAGNWASAMWAFAPGAEKKLADKVLMSSPNQVDQLGGAYGYDRSEERYPGQPCMIRRQRAGTADAPQRAPRRPPAMAAVVSVSPPARTAASNAYWRWRASALSVEVMAHQAV